MEGLKEFLSYGSGYGYGDGSGYGGGYGGSTIRKVLKRAEEYTNEA